jgi:ubiquinone/menaquinone biosynthesis C-methylase UbiE
VPDLVFGHPRLASVYDDLDPDRSDLTPYVALAHDLQARRVLDVGCGTGTFALLLAEAGISVTGVDPAQASVDVARSKRGSERVRWLVGDATTLPQLEVDLATMTANVAQVFLTDADFEATLRAIRRALARGGHLVLETRDPGRRAWEDWTPERTQKSVEVPGVGLVESWRDVTHVDGAFVTFRSTFVFHTDGEEIASESTLRFRSRAELDDSLQAAGFEVREVRDAPDRPGREWVYVARTRTDTPPSSTTSPSRS